MRSPLYHSIFVNFRLSYMRLMRECRLVGLNFCTLFFQVILFDSFSAINWTSLQRMVDNIVPGRNWRL